MLRIANQPTGYRLPLQVANVFVRNFGEKPPKFRRWPRTLVDGASMSGFPNQGWDRVLHIVGKTLGKVSDRLFAASDQRQAQKHAEDLGSRIETDWAYLLEKHSGRVAQEPQPRTRSYFNYASCRVKFPDLEMLISEGRNEIRVQVRSGQSADWLDLSAIIYRDAPLPQDGLIAFSNAIEQDWRRISKSVRERRA